jgi:uncharacterized SAM-binding protein YcdF (DUF218 family)
VVDLPDGRGHHQLNTEVRALAKVLWDYHDIDQRLPDKVDFVLAAGSHDDRVAHHAAALMLDRRAPLLVTSGGFGKITSALRTEPEGERFRDIAIAAGVPAESVLVEPAATNTGDNVTFTRSLLAERGIHPVSGLIVTKPYMKRRAIATAGRQWPEVRWWTSAPHLEFEKYPTDDVPERRMIELMVGDLQRIRVYADQGFQEPQDIPREVWEAYAELVELGYDRFVIRGQERSHDG